MSDNVYREILEFKIDPLKKFFESQGAEPSLCEQELLADLERILAAVSKKRTPQPDVYTKASESLIEWLGKREQLTDSEKKLVVDYQEALMCYGGAVFQYVNRKVLSETPTRPTALPPPQTREEAIERFVDGEVRRQRFFEKLDQDPMLRLHQQLVRLGAIKDATPEECEAFDDRIRAAMGSDPGPRLH